MGDLLFFGIDDCVEDVVDVLGQSIWDIGLSLGGGVSLFDGCWVVEGEAPKI